MPKKSTKKLNEPWVSDPIKRNELAKQYAPLVYKIVNQYMGRTPLSYDDLVGFAFEGFTMAMNDYSPDKGQTFAQYAGWAIKYRILNGANNEGHTVKFSAYMQSKLKEEGASTWIMKSIDIHTDEDGEERCNIIQPSVDAEEAFRPAIFDSLYNSIEDRFSKRDCEIFYQTYGLKMFDITKGTELAKKYGCSGTNITLINQKIIEYIRGNEDLMDELSALL